MVDRVGQQLGNYRLTSLLGKGGFADVYLAEHIHLETQAAVKVLSMRLTSDNMEQFRSEARIVTRLNHPYIVRVLDFGVEDNTPYLIMGYAPNGSLRQHHPKGTRLPLDTIIDYVKQVTAALQYAHERKLIHRDIKPENMLLDENHQVLLSDFGIALVAQSTRYQNTQEVIGTAAYMAPEQLQGKPRRASDQYSLGIVVYEWICGNRPFQGSFTEIYSQQMFVPPPPLCEKVPELPSSVEEVVLTALAKDPKERFRSVQAFANALELASQPEKPSVGVSGPTTSPLSPLSPPQVEEVSRQASQVPPIAAPLAVTVASPQANSSSLDSDALEAKPIKLWSIDKRKVVAMAFGSVLYAGLGQFGTALRFPSLPSLSFPIFPAIVIPLFFGTIFGPWVGLITGGLGYLLEHYISGNPFVWSESLGLILIGFIAGLAILRTRGHYLHARAIIIAEGISAIAIVLGIACGAYSDILALKFTVGIATKAYLSDMLPDLIISLILLPILLVLYSRVDKRTRNA
jgi:serine/threonine protein kinase